MRSENARHQVLAAGEQTLPDAAAAGNACGLLDTCAFAARGRTHCSLHIGPVDSLAGKAFSFFTHAFSMHHVPDIIVPSITATDLNVRTRKE